MGPDAIRKELIDEFVKEIIAVRYKIFKQLKYVFAKEQNFENEDQLEEYVENLMRVWREEKTTKGE